MTTIATLKAACRNVEAMHYAGLDTDQYEEHARELYHDIISKAPELKPECDRIMAEYGI